MILCDAVGGQDLPGNNTDRSRYPHQHLHRNFHILARRCRWSGISIVISETPIAFGDARVRDHLGIAQEYDSEEEVGEDIQKDDEVEL